MKEQKKNEGNVGRGSWVYRGARDVVYIVSKIIFRLEIHGAENIPAEGSCVLASNHVSFLDPPLIACAARFQRRAVRFMARDTLYSSSFGSWFLDAIHAIPLSRNKGDIGALRIAIKTIKSGSPVALFPEGTRTEDGELKEAKGGVAFLVAKSGVPVVPIYIDGIYAAFPKDAKFIKPRKVRIFVGKPLQPSELKPKKKGTEGYKEVGDYVMSKIARLRPPKCTSLGNTKNAI